MMVSAEREILQREVERLAAEGFDVFLEPGPALAPSFAGGYLPDAIAIGKGRRIALEVSNRSDATEKKLSGVAALFGSHPDWEFRVVWAEPTVVAQRLPVQTKAEIGTAIKEIKKLRDEGYLRPAFLLAWATFEATARAVAHAEFERPQTPGRVVQVLGREGFLTPDEADELRALTQKRNTLVHGGLDADVSAGDVDRMVRALEEIAKEVSAD